MSYLSLHISTPELRVSRFDSPKPHRPATVHINFIESGCDLSLDLGLAKKLHADLGAVIADIEANPRQQELHLEATSPASEEN